MHLARSYIPLVTILNAHYENNYTSMRTMHNAPNRNTGFANLETLLLQSNSNLRIESPLYYIGGANRFSFYCVNYALFSIISYIATEHPKVS